jgi:hypothetical protein
MFLFAQWVHDIIYSGCILAPVALMPVVSQRRGLLSPRFFLHGEICVRFPSKEEWPQIWLAASVLSLLVLSAILLKSC